MTFLILKNELRNYHAYKSEMYRLQALYRDTFYKATGVSGIDNTKIKVMISEDSALSMKLDTIERLNDIEKDYKEVKYKLGKCNYWLSKLPSQLQKEVMDVFVYNTKKRDRNNVYRLSVDCDKYLKK